MKLKTKIVLILIGIATGLMLAMKNIQEVREAHKEQTKV